MANHDNPNFQSSREFDRVLVWEISKPLTEGQLKELEIIKKRMRIKIIKKY